MIAQEIQNALNQQMNDDDCSWYYYRAAAAYCDESDLRGLAKWLRKQSETKRHRATKIYDYILQRRGHVELKPIAASDAQWGSPLAVLDGAIEHERRVAVDVARLAELSLAAGDHSTHRFVEHFTREQAEAESKLERVAERLRLLGDVPTGLFMFDEALA
jgi:ferritin